MRVREGKDVIVPSMELKISKGSQIHSSVSILLGDILLERVEGLVPYGLYKLSAIEFKESIMIPQVRSEIDFRGEMRIQHIDRNCGR